jgi:hypothetical protein
MQTTVKNNNLIIDTKADVPLEYKIDLGSLSSEQIHYLEILSKYSPRKNRIKIVQPQDIPLRKDVYVKENIQYLNMNDQVRFNDLYIQQDKDKYNAAMLTGGAFMATFLYYIISAPLSRSLLKEGFKSLFLGATLGYGYMRIKREDHINNLHGFYLQIINEKRNRRLTRAEMENNK